ncbi:MAG: M48 family metallopeptidase [Pseudomonadota bacterium]
MRVSPRLPDDSVNVSKTHPLAEAGTLLAGIGIAFIVVTITIVFAVDILLRLVPPATEVRWLSKWSPFEIEAEQSPEQQELEALLARMARHWQTDYQFRIAIDDNSLPNAMALPGGLILVTRGLLDAVETENELAFVLGHELGHFAERDHIRQLGRATVLMLFLSAVSGGSGGANIGYSFTDLTLRGFNRQQESRADEFGLALLHDEYGHVADAGAFFGRINTNAEATVFNRYLGTHPMPIDRVDALRSLAKQRGWATNGATTPWDANNSNANDE